MERLRELDGEHLRYESSKPGAGGTGPLLLTPLELIERIAALVPPPRIHRHHYFGVLARTAAHGKFPRRPRTAGVGRSATVVPPPKPPPKPSSTFDGYARSYATPRLCSTARTQKPLLRTFAGSRFANPRCRKRLNYSRGHFVRPKAAASIRRARVCDGAQRPPWATKRQAASTTVAALPSPVGRANASSARAR
jgi:hypothetical protein